MLKRTRKRRGGDLYAGQLEPAIKAATELATVLQGIKATLPSDLNAPNADASNADDSNADASNVTPAPASNDAASSPASSAPASNAASDSNDDAAVDAAASEPVAATGSEPAAPATAASYGNGPFVISGTNFAKSSSIQTILSKMKESATDDATKQKLQTILSEISAAPNGKEIAKILANHNIQLAAGTKNIFTMSGGTKKRRMRRTKRRTMRRTKRRTMRKKMRKTQKKR